MRIYLADDEVKVCSALRLLLEQEPGWHVVWEVNDAKSLVSRLEKKNGAFCSEIEPGVLLLDWELPGFQAKNFIKTLREDCPHIKIIAISARAYNRPEALAAGVDAFVSKVDPPEQVIATVRSLNS